MKDTGNRKNQKYKTAAKEKKDCKLLIENKPNRENEREKT